MLTHAERTETWLAALRGHGYRLTAPRQAVVAAVAESDRALIPAEVHDQARRAYPRLGLVTVYRTLEKLEELHLVQRVHRPDNCQAFVAGVEGHQHLLICQKCGRVQYFSGDQLGALIQRVQADSGYEIHDHWLQLFGECGEC
ncbi:MAG: transcriptional repressor [Anaerolineae bacterium]|nr:MAG: transcriptional repressor [Anaerolineae bacterium]